MMYLGLQLLFRYLAFLVLVASASPLAAPNFPIAKLGCSDRCGSVSIPFPFGTTDDCYLGDEFFINCSQSYSPPKAFLRKSNIEITNISLDGQLKVLSSIGYECYGKNKIRVDGSSPTVSFKSFTISNTANKFTMVGCDTYGYVFGRRHNGDKGTQFQTGCIAKCAAEEELAEGPCTGLGCCQTSIPKQIWKVELEVSSFGNYSDVWEFDRCGYAFVAEEHALNFSAGILSELKNITELPMVVDWDIGNLTCKEAEMNHSTYACKSENSRCDKPDNGDGYRCSCLKGYLGNPYLVEGCKDVDECKDPNLNDCEEHHCKNTPGRYACFCPKGYHGDGRRTGKGCTHGESLVFRIVAGVALGVIVILLAAFWLYLELSRRRLIKMRQKFFFQNGGDLLREKLTRTRSSSSDTARIFSESEMQKATDNFHTDTIIGQGGHGTVYKGVLPDNKVVAIKKSKVVNLNEIEQFINEVIVLSQVNHRNVVKLLGCCLETQVPLLVYEFISNGTLFEHVHNKAKAHYLSWDMRFRIATETAGVLSYLHSVASVPIIHRDVKSENILLDHSFTAKVSDFGASRLVPLDQTQLNTLVQGTLGYLDPEYLQTQQLTEKSDVYSFGVVLVELLTGRKAVRSDGSEEERCLANVFLKVMQQEHRLYQVLEDIVVRESNRELVMKVAVLAKRCLNLKGDERPSMKEVAMELEGLRVGGKHSWMQTEHIAEDKESLIGKGFSGFSKDEGSSTSVGVDSLNDHIVLPVGDGRKLAINARYLTCNW